MSNYYSIKNMTVPTKEFYEILHGESVLLVGTATHQDWAVSIDIDPQSPCDILANGLSLPFASKSFDVVILDYVTNFLPKQWMIEKIILDANRVGKRVIGRASVTFGKRMTIGGPKIRYTHKEYPSGVRWFIEKENK